MFDVKKFIAELQSQNVAEEEIRRQLEGIKAEIDAYLSPAPTDEEKKIDPSGKETKVKETAEEKEARIFGI